MRSKISQAIVTVELMIRQSTSAESRRPCSTPYYGMVAGVAHTANSKSRLASRPRRCRVVIGESPTGYRAKLQHLGIEIDDESFGLERACDRDVARLARVGPERKYYQDLSCLARSLSTRPRILPH